MQTQIPMDNRLKLSEDSKTIKGVSKKRITHITIPNSVTEIGKGALSWLSELQL